MLNKFFTTTLLFITFCSYTFAQEKKKDVTAPETPKEIKLEKKLAKKLYSIPQFANETSLFIKQPTKWISSDWVKLGAVCLATKFSQNTWPSRRRT